MKCGDCRYGANCKFDHPERLESLIASLDKNECYDFRTTGECRYGDRCKYVHPLGPSVQLVSGSRSEDEPEATSNRRSNRLVVGSVEPPTPPMWPTPPTDKASAVMSTQRSPAEPLIQRRNKRHSPPSPSLPPSNGGYSLTAEQHVSTIQSFVTPTPQQTLSGTVGTQALQTDHVVDGMYMAPQNYVQAYTTPPQAPFSASVSNGSDCFVITNSGPVCNFRGVRLTSFPGCGTDGSFKDSLENSNSLDRLPLAVSDPMMYDVGLGDCTASELGFSKSLSGEWTPPTRPLMMEPNPGLSVAGEGWWPQVNVETTQRGSQSAFDVGMPDMWHWNIGSTAQVEVTVPPTRVMSSQVDRTPDGVVIDKVKAEVDALFDTKPMHPSLARTSDELDLPFADDSDLGLVGNTHGWGPR